MLEEELEAQNCSVEMSHCVWFMSWQGDLVALRRCPHLCLTNPPKRAAGRQPALIAVHPKDCVSPGYIQIRNSMLVFSAQDKVAEFRLPGTGYKSCTYVFMLWHMPLLLVLL